MQGYGLIQNILPAGQEGPPSTIISQYNTDPSAVTILYALMVAPLTYAVSRKGLEFSPALSIGFALISGFAMYSQWPRNAATALGKVTVAFGSAMPRGQGTPNPFMSG